MRPRNLAALFAAVAMTALFYAPAASASTTPAAPATAESTRFDARTAAHDEAYAYAIYRAYAAEAERTGRTGLAQLFTRTADVELHEHFTAEATVAGLVGDDAANLQSVVDGETFEHRTMYPMYAMQALADHCPAAADLFVEIAGDEGRHAAAFALALRSLTDERVQVPSPPKVDRTTIDAGAPICTGQTRANLLAAMHGEAFAYAKYRLFAEHADRAGHRAIADLFAATADGELFEHFAEEAVLAGAVGAATANVVAAINDEITAATETYPGFAARADHAGDTSAARLFREIAGDELHHAAAFAAELGTP